MKAARFKGALPTLLAQIVDIVSIMRPLTALAPDLRNSGRQT